ncbi:MAG: hypothetical protein QM831_19980 [Kofleriaceae bacterium]
MAFTCSANGASYELQACDLGCGEDPIPHCKVLQPKYLEDVCGSAVQTDLDITSTGSLDPNLDSTCTGGVVMQGGGANLCVIRNRSFTVDDGVTLTLTGSQYTDGRGVAIVTDNDLIVHGFIDASGHNGINGPGGGTFESGGIGSSSNTLASGGGAGGSTAGGPGATSMNAGATGTNGGANNGGAIVMNPALLASFVGGASTHNINVNDGSQTYPFFGGGGGALVLVSCHGAVTVDGTINVGGGGGNGGLVFLPAIPASGGGAGGNIVIQAPTITITGSVFANGGGGGQGFPNGTGEGAIGGDGSLSDAPVENGGHNELQVGGDGGRGGYLDQPGTDGLKPSGMNGGPGGGGGGAGFLQTYTPTGIQPTITPAHASPAFQENGTVERK